MACYSMTEAKLRCLRALAATPSPGLLQQLLRLAFSLPCPQLEQMVVVAPQGGADGGGAQEVQMQQLPAVRAQDAWAVYNAVCHGGGGTGPADGSGDDEGKSKSKGVGEGEGEGEAGGVGVGGLEIGWAFLREEWRMVNGLFGA